MNIPLIDDKDDVLNLIFLLLKLSKGFSDTKKYSDYIKIQGFLALNQNLFFSDEKGEEIWLKLVTYSQTEYLPLLKAKLDHMRDQDEQRKVTI